MLARRYLTTAQRPRRRGHSPFALLLTEGVSGGGKKVGPEWYGGHPSSWEGSRDGQLFEGSESGNARFGSGEFGDQEFGDNELGDGDVGVGEFGKCAERFLESGMVWDSWRRFCGTARGAVCDIWVAQRETRLLLDSASGRHYAEFGPRCAELIARRLRVRGRRG